MSAMFFEMTLFILYCLKCTLAVFFTTNLMIDRTYDCKQAKGGNVKINMNLKIKKYLCINNLFYFDLYISRWVSRAVYLFILFI